MVLYCRACLNVIEDGNYLPLDDSKSSIHVTDQLNCCVPEMVIDLVINPIICLPCVYDLQAAYRFKTKCLQTEQRIENYMHTLYETRGSINVTDLDDELSNLCMKFTPKNYNKIRTGIVADELNNLLDDALENIHRDNVAILDEDDVQVIPSDTEDVPTTHNEVVQESSAADNIQPTVSNVKETSKGAKAKNGTKPILSCKLCNYTSSRVDWLNAHKKRHTEKCNMICTICNYRGTSKINFKSHMEYHKEPPTLSCEVCAYKCLVQDQLLLHMQEAHNVKRSRGRPRRNRKHGQQGLQKLLSK